MNINIETAVPFEACKDCPYFRIEANLVFDRTEKGPKAAAEYTCEHASFCQIIIQRYKRAERTARPYDAMGDDEGRGGETGDSWYKENFTRAAAYKKDLIDRGALIRALEARIELEEQKPMTGLKTVPLLKQVIETVKKMRSQNGEDKA